MKRFLFYMAIFCPLLCSAQQELSIGTTLNLPPKSYSMPKLAVPDNLFHTNTFSHDSVVRIAVGESSFGKPVFKTTAISAFNGNSVPISWRNGKVVFAGSVTRMPGLMQIDNGAVGISQHFGNFSLYGGGVVNKYGFHRGVFTQYGVEGTLSYQFSKRLSVSAFASYYFGGVPVFGNGAPLPPAMIGYFDTSKFGGYLDYKVNDKWGVYVGGQAVQRFGTNKYQVEPIVTPYFKVGKVGIGLPIGQIVNGLIREQIDKRNFKAFGRRPTPPKK